MTNNRNILRKLNGRKVIKISHELNLASYSLGIIAMDILFTAIAQIADEDKELNEYLISISDLEKKIGRKLNRVSLKKAHEELTGCDVSLKGGKSIFWFSKIEISSTEGYINFQLNNELSEHLINPDYFVLASLEKFLNLQSYYSKRMYLFASQFARRGKFTLSIDRLKSMLMVPDSLLLYSNLKSRVINLAVKQINDYSDIVIKVQELKIGRFVKDIEINVCKTEIVKKPKVNINARKHKSGVIAVENWLQRVKSQLAESQ